MRCKTHCEVVGIFYGCTNCNSILRLTYTILVAHGLEFLSLRLHRGKILNSLKAYSPVLQHLVVFLIPSKASLEISKPICILMRVRSAYSRTHLIWWTRIGCSSGLWWTLADAIILVTLFILPPKCSCTVAMPPMSKAQERASERYRSNPECVPLLADCAANAD